MDLRIHLEEYQWDFAHRRLQMILDKSLADKNKISMHYSLTKGQ